MINIIIIYFLLNIGVLIILWASDIMNHKVKPDFYYEGNVSKAILNNLPAFTKFLFNSYLLVNSFSFSDAVTDPRIEAVPASGISDML